MDNLFPALWLSLKVAICATFINLILGTLTAYWLAKRRIIARDFWDTILTLPMVLPPTVMGYYLLVAFGKQGPIGQWLQQWGINLIFTWQGAVIAAAVVTFPLVVKPARASFEQVQTQWEHAARTLRLSESAVFWRITLPLAWRGILAGMLLAFARALGEFGATLMIAGSIPNETQTLSIAVYEAVQAGDDALANRLVLIISLVCITILWLAQYLTKPRYQR